MLGQIFTLQNTKSQVSLPIQSKNLHASKIQFWVLRNICFVDSVLSVLWEF